jgi:glycosyltransferase involved in cell wall biosynthesis
VKVHWLIPLTCDAAFQFTSKNELARAFRSLGNTITTTVAYANEQTTMDGFSEVEYIHIPRKSLLGKIKFHWKMVQSTWTRDADVVIFGFQASHLIPLAWAVRRVLRNQVKFVMDIRTVPVDIDAGLKGWMQVPRYKLAIWLADRFCDGLTVITPMLRNEIVAKVRRLSNRIGVWSSGANLDHFRRHGGNYRDMLGLDGKQVLIYHGVLSRYRGLQNALRAVNILRNEFPNLAFVLIGEGAGRQELEETARDLGLCDVAKFVGRVSYENMPGYLRSADLGILPFPNISWWTVSSPIKLMEYLAIGLPIVATDIEANRCVVSKTGGAILAKSDDPQHLAEGIRMALNEGVKTADRDILEMTISWNREALKLERFFARLGA